MKYTAIIISMGIDKTAIIVYNVRKGEMKPE
jgi:hypothetical protein